MDYHFYVVPHTVKAGFHKGNNTLLIPIKCSYAGWQWRCNSIGPYMTSSHIMLIKTPILDIVYYL